MLALLVLSWHINTTATRNRKPQMSIILTATYTAAYKRIVVKFYADDSAEVASMGEVSEDEEMAAVAAQGANIAGWSVDFS